MAKAKNKQDDGPTSKSWIASQDCIKVVEAYKNNELLELTQGCHHAHHH